MSLAAWKLWVDLGQFALTALVALFVWLTKQSQVNRAAIDALATAQRDAMNAMGAEIDARIDQVDARVIHIETTVKSGPSTQVCGQHMARLSAVEEALRHTPGHEDLKRVHVRIDKVSELASKIDGRLQGIERSLGMIQQYLLDSGRHD